jgi:hypothetical protein
MMARMKSLEDFGRKFSNRREWRDFISAVQCPVNYPVVLSALRASMARVAIPAALAEPVK